MNRYADILLALLLAVFTVQAQAGIVIGGHGSFITATKETSASIRNPDRSGVWLVQSWVDSGMKGIKRRLSSRRRCFALTQGREHPAHCAHWREPA
jgi:P pilus assembly chaperone PapD